MKEKSSAHYQREYRRRLRELGLVKKEVWILPTNSKWLSKFEKLLRSHFDESKLDEGVLNMTQMKRWTTSSLFDVMAVEPLFDGECATIELIDGAEPTIHIVMHDYGDLAIFLTVAGEQIIVEAVLWSVDEVKDLAAFNDAVLRTHKYFPLSTISLDTLANGKEYYQMFGALSASSILPSVIFEIEALASNVIQATEAYGDYLLTSHEAEVR
ncbi:YjfI family protein [Agarilytica rhodophyticola]|uniref:YjfI family protein n=1 Tax=Agarilytica rhodophyticola TaxID=1737490 RepID=UPI000B34228A|nr:YjfI family protein [Agarilytica rhodophyticola]